MAEQEKKVQEPDLNQLRKVRREKLGSSGKWKRSIPDYKV